MTARIAFDVAGTPVPQGSTRAFAKNGKVVTTSDPTGRLERWRGDVRQAAKAVLPTGFEPLTSPVQIAVAFAIARPKSHYLPVNRSRLVPVLRPDAPIWCDGGPDLDKLVRSVMDALSLVVYVDDRQVVAFGHTEKRWSQLPGASIEIAERLP